MGVLSHANKPINASNITANAWPSEQDRGEAACSGAAESKTPCPASARPLSSSAGSLSSPVCAQPAKMVGVGSWDLGGCHCSGLAAQGTTADGRPRSSQVLHSDIDLLNPPAELEKQKHKLKRLVQSPNSFFMVSTDVCSACKSLFDEARLLRPWLPPEQWPRSLRVCSRAPSAGRQVPGVLQHVSWAPCARGSTRLVSCCAAGGARGDCDLLLHRCARASRLTLCLSASAAVRSTTVFSHSQTVVLCGSCSTVLCTPTGGRARLTEGCSFRRKGD